MNPNFVFCDTGQMGNLLAQQAQQIQQAAPDFGWTQTLTIIITLAGLGFAACALAWRIGSKYDDLLKRQLDDAKEQHKRLEDRVRKNYRDLVLRCDNVDALAEDVEQVRQDMEEIGLSLSKFKLKTAS